MRTALLTGAIATAMGAGMLVGLPAATAQTTTDTVTIRAGDFLPELSGTRDAGHYEFLTDGLHLWTDDDSSQAKVAEYFPISGGLADMVGSGLTWYGTSPAPGAQLVFDASVVQGDEYNILVGESIYGDDWWLTSGSSSTAKAVCPETGAGFGSACHGTLEQWAQALPQAMVYAGGFSLGSGVEGDGVLVSQRYGDTEYRFTSEPEPAPVRAATMRVTPAGVVYRSTVRVQGTLVSDGAGVAGQQVTIWQRTAKGWVRAGAATTGSDGTWSTVVRPKRTTTLRATAAGYPTASATVTVALRVVAKATQHKVTAKVAPALKHHKTVLFKVTKRGVHKVAADRTNAHSKVVFRQLPKGVYLVAAKKAPGYVLGMSNPVRVRR